MVSAYTKNLDILNRIQFPYYLQKQLEMDYKSDESWFKDQIDERVNQYKNIFQQFSIIQNFSASDIGDIHGRNSDFLTISKNASIYFKQGLEMFNTAKNVSDINAPLLEYYAYLQCVKGLVICHLDIKENPFFRYHGIISDKNRTDLTVKVKHFGVFQALLLTTRTDKVLNSYLDGNYKPDLAQFINQGKGTFEHGGDIIKAFIGLWMLSTYVRYRPSEWQKILAGEENEMIIHINNFRKSFVPFSTARLLESIRLIGKVI